jgi:hypothetical protein
MQVTVVSQQLTSLIARHSTTTTAPTKKPAPPAATAKPAHAATAATPASTAAAAPKKPTNATAVWNPVVSRRTKRKQQAYPPAERRIVVQLVEAPNDAQKAADTALRTVNRALVGQPDVSVPPLYTTYVSRTNALVFTAGPDTVAATTSRSSALSAMLWLRSRPFLRMSASYGPATWYTGSPPPPRPTTLAKRSSGCIQLQSWLRHPDDLPPPRTDEKRPPPPWSSPLSATPSYPRCFCSTASATFASTFRSTT